FDPSSTTTTSTSGMLARNRCRTPPMRLPSLNAGMTTSVSAERAVIRADHARPANLRRLAARTRYTRRRALHRDRARLPVHRDRGRIDPRRPLARRLVLLALLVALPPEHRDQTGVP